MLDTLPVLNPRLECRDLLSDTRSGTGTSDAAQFIRKAVWAFVESTERSLVWFGPKATALHQLYEVANEAAESGWDGGKALPIDPRAVDRAARIVRAFPAWAPLPEFAPEPDGSISLDWLQSRSRVFSLSVGRSNRLAYAWIDGGSRGHGVEHFDDERVPTRILEGINEIVKRGNASVGPR